MPEAATATTPLARRITSVEQLTPLATAALQTLHAEHDTEILKIQDSLARAHKAGRTDTATIVWQHSARRALKVLKLHRTWIGRELATRAATGASTAKLARLQLATSTEARAITVFKEVAHEVLGDEMYSHLWLLTQQRLEAA